MNDEQFHVRVLCSVIIFRNLRCLVKMDKKPQKETIHTSHACVLIILSLNVLFVLRFITSPETLPIISEFKTELCHDPCKLVI